MGDLSDFQKGQVIGARLVGASVTKMATLFSVAIAAVSIVMAAYTNHGKTSSATRTCDRKPKLIERDRRTLMRIVSKNDRTTAAKVTPELSIHLQVPVRRELHKSNIHGRTAIAKPLITENNAKRRKGWCDNHKIWTSDDWIYVIWSDESSSSTLFPTSGRVNVCRTPKEDYVPEWFQL